MPNLPVRGVGTIGVITDVSPTDLPISSWSNARNVRFQGDAVTRSSVFKPFLIQPDFSTSKPILVIDDTLRSSTKYITTLLKNGTLTRISNGVVSDVSPTTPFITTSNANATTTTVGSVIYINNEFNVPISYTEGEGRYSQIPNWNPNDRCKSLRSYKDFLIALNISNINTEYPNMIKWSNAVQVGQRPDWNVADEASLAGENVLNVSTGKIVDGYELGNSFIIYGTNEVFLMSYVGEPFIFDFRKLFNNFSIMTQNCVYEIQSRHYVFCEDDIVVTDGSSYQSICNGKVKQTIFSRIDYSKRNNCRVFHNSVKRELIFAYPSFAQECAWVSSETGCNEAAVYNYANETWSFIDLPNVSTAVEAMQPVGSMEESKTWAGMVSSWSNQINNWSFTTESPSTLIMSQAGNENYPAKLVFFDDAVNGRIGNSLDEETYWPAWCEMMLYDFDEQGIALSDRKWIKTIIPQVFTEINEQSVSFQIKGDLLVTDTSNWPAPIMFNPHKDYKIDTRIEGRYISLRYNIPAQVSARLNGFDIDVTRISGR